MSEIASFKMVTGSQFKELTLKLNEVTAVWDRDPHRVWRAPKSSRNYGVTGKYEEVLLVSIAVKSGQTFWVTHDDGFDNELDQAGLHQWVLDRLQFHA